MNKIEYNKIKTHKFKNVLLNFEVRGSIETQPGLTINHARISAKENKILQIDFELGIENTTKYSFGFQNWIFIPESGELLSFEY